MIREGTLVTYDGPTYTVIKGGNHIGFKNCYAFNNAS